MTDKEQVVKRLVGIHCPKGNAEISWLRKYVSGENYYILDEGGGYEEQEFQSDGTTNDYECPECSELLFTEGDKAEKFLKGVG